MKAPAWAGFAAVAMLVVFGVEAWFWRDAFLPAPAQHADSPPKSEPEAPTGASSSPELIIESRSRCGGASGDHGQRRFDIASELDMLFGRNSVRALLRLEDFPRRVVATVNNLDRAHAPSALWPAIPAGGHFSVEARGNAQYIAADNERRYTPYMMLIEAVDMQRVFAFYCRLYPQLQQAYLEEGYPDRSFNSRLVEVIDVILSTPRVDGDLQVQLPEIVAPVQPPRPWVFYSFDDPHLDALSAGQKILLRMGPVNGQRLRANLAEFRVLLTSQAAPR